MFTTSRATHSLSAPKITDKLLRHISSDHCHLMELDLSRFSYDYIDAELKFEQKVGPEVLKQKGITPLPSAESLQTLPIDLEQFKKIAEAMKKNNSLKILNLSDVPDESNKEEFISILIEIIKNTRSMKKLILDGWSLSSAQVNKLLTALRTSDIHQMSFQRCQFDNILKAKELIDVFKKRENFLLNFFNSNMSDLLFQSPLRVNITFQLLRKKFPSEIVFDNNTLDLLNAAQQKRLTYPSKDEKEYKSIFIASAKQMLFNNKACDAQTKNESHCHSQKRKTL